MHKMRPHRGDPIVDCCVPAHRLHLAARLLIRARYLSLQRDIRVVSLATGSLCCGITTCCPKDELQTLSKGSSVAAAHLPDGGELISLSKPCAHEPGLSCYSLLPL